MLKTPQRWRVFLSILFLYFSAHATSFAQRREYVPFHAKDTTNAYHLALAHQRSLKNAFVEPTGVSKDYRKKYQAIVEESAAEVYNTVRYTALQDTVFNPFVQEVFRKITEANKHLPPARLILTRSPIENAYALADGTILFNIGLLAKLENESQVAFIICHELAHIYYGHMQAGLKSHLDALYSKVFRQEAKKIVRQEYNLHAKMNALVMRTAAHSLYHKRTHEKQADSLGYVLLSNTSYDPAQAYTALQLLDSIDAPFSSDEIDLQGYFNCTGTPGAFDKRAAKAASIFAVDPKETAEAGIADTLKTHPDCAKRMQYIQQLSQARQAKGSKQQVSASFHKMVTNSRMEVVQSWYDFGRYDQAFFNALLLLKNDPQNSYLQAIVMLCLYEFKAHLLAHRASDVIAAASNAFPANFNHVLSALHRLDVSDFSGLSRCFRQQFAKEAPANEYMLAATYAYAVLNNETDQAEAIKAQYAAQYPSGKFINTIFLANQK